MNWAYLEALESIKTWDYPIWALIIDDNWEIITARNKMRTAKEKLVECTLSSRVIETPYLSISEELNIENTNKTQMLWML